jgi:hypothetical protein
MRDGLRQQGLLPTTEPYSAMGYSYLNNEAPLTVPASMFNTTGPNAIVDWVLVELITNGEVRARVPALLQCDRDVVATNGDSLLRFNLPRGVYWVAVRHRNHLVGARTNNTSFFGNAAQVTRDLSLPFGMEFAETDVNGVSLMIAGNVTGDHQVKYTGANNDRDPILLRIGGTTPTSVLHGQYRSEDVNMDGDIKYTGAGNDRDTILINVGGTTPTAVRTAF